MVAVAADESVSCTVDLCSPQEYDDLRLLLFEGADDVSALV
jgi:hypothetical protein